MITKGLIVCWTVHDGPHSPVAFEGKDIPEQLTANVVDRPTAFWEATNLPKSGYSPTPGKLFRTDKVGSNVKNGLLRRILYALDIDEKDTVLKTVQVGHMWTIEGMGAFKFSAYIREDKNGNDVGYIGDNVRPTDMMLEMFNEKYIGLYGNIQGRKVREGLTDMVKDDGGIALKSKGGTYLVPTPSPGVEERYHKVAEWMTQEDIGTLVVLPYFGSEGAYMESILAQAQADMQADIDEIVEEARKLKTSSAKGKTRQKMVDRVNGLKEALAEKYGLLRAMLDDQIVAPAEGVLSAVGETIKQEEIIIEDDIVDEEIQDAMLAL